SAEFVGRWRLVGFRPHAGTADRGRVYPGAALPDDRPNDTFELCVGVMLVLLGANVLRALACRGASHTHDHTTVAIHSHRDAWLIARPLLVGIVHGLAGSAPLLLLTLTVMSSPLAAFSYMAVFGVGSMMGMSIMSVLVSVPARLAVEHFACTHLALRGL